MYEQLLKSRSDILQPSAESITKTTLAAEAIELLCRTERQPAPSPGYGLDKEDLDRYNKERENLLKKLTSHKPSEHLNDESKKHLRVLQEALLAPPDFNSHDYAHNPDKFVQAVKDLSKSNQASINSVIKALNESLDGTNIKIGHTTGQVAISYERYDKTFEWYVVSGLAGAHKPEVKAFSTNVAESKYFPLDHREVYENIQQTLTKPPKWKVIK